MKQKDLTLVIVIAVVSGILSLLLSNMLFAKPENMQVKAEYVDPISKEFEQPSTEYFNGTSINLTQLIRIGDGSNITPFNGQ